MSATKISVNNNTEVIMEKSIEKGLKLMITTHLMGREETFRMMALAHAAKLPLLLVGEPGVAKTNTVLDYAASSHDTKTEEGKAAYEQAVYILETDEGTKSAEVKGRLNMREYIQNANWILNTPIADADYVVVNEIDKASSGLRNSLLGVMNEKILFNGDSKVPCQWKLFVGTCNEIPKDEVGNPFWDRFILKMKVTRMNPKQIEDYYNSGDKKYTKEIEIYIPTDEEVQAIKIPQHKLKKFLDVTYKDLSDRTLTYVPKLTKIASIVYGIRIDQALVKVASILVGETAANTLSKSLISQEMQTIYNKIDLLKGIKDQEHYERVTEEISMIISNFSKTGKLNSEQIDELKEVLDEIEQNSGFGVELVDDVK